MSEQEAATVSSLDTSAADKQKVLAREAEITRQNEYHEPAVLPVMDRITKKITAVAMFLPAFVVCIMFYEVVVRYFFKAPTLWVNEMSLWVAGFIYLLAGLHTMQQRAHIRVTVLYDVVGPRIRRVFDTITLLCIIGFAVGLIIGAHETVYKALMRWEKLGTAWNPPLPATVKPMILVATFLVTCQAISNYCHDADATGNPRKADNCGLLSLLGIAAFTALLVILILLKHFA